MMNTAEQFEQSRKGRGKGGSSSSDENSTGGTGGINLDLNETIGSTNKSSGGSSYEVAEQTYKGYAMVGTLEIPSIKLKYPVLDRATKMSMEVSIGLVYGKLNQVGNATIMGHNYRNGTFFSNLKKVKEGDKLYITDTTGLKVEYVVYQMYETSSTDFDYASRDTGGKREVSLSTCTDDVKARLIVLAREVG